MEREANLMLCRQHLMVAAECAEAGGEYRLALDLRVMASALPMPSLEQMALELSERAA